MKADERQQHARNNVALHDGSSEGVNESGMGGHGGFVHTFSASGGDVPRRSARRENAAS
jgi:hypothetical protein